MVDGFERLTTGVTSIYKSIQKIKRLRMDSIGLKGTHVMCIYYLYTNPEGLTGADLCSKCREDKAGISRILSDLESACLICYKNTGDGRKYRAKAVLTEQGKTCGAKVTRLIEHAAVAGGTGLTDQEREIFYKVLFTISDNLETLCSSIEEGKSL
ncbi:MAG: MarR family winged helix-turn-helix transcriptional regulator [Eubacteriales bacterium]|nr:MarR family winged helix-turn-helix transcriptional regulator [Eubacteriales bacterium]